MGFHMFSGAPRMPDHIPAPAGRIESREELRDLVIEARKEKKAIRIYLVQQSGYIGEFFITSKSRLQKPDSETGLCSGDRFHKLNGKQLSGFDSHKAPKHRYYSTDILTGSFNIGAPAISHHYAFTNRALAERHSRTLKTDPVYVKYVRDWHAYCDRAFSRYVA